MKFKEIILLAGTLFLTLSLSAQHPKDYLLADIERSAGFYHSYEAPGRLPEGQPSRGYKPFYISHYSRHGSRWHASEMRYSGTLRFFEEADSLGILTQVGRRFMEDLRTVVEDADGRLGDLSPRGTREHKGIADRMYRAYPEVFHQNAEVDSRSSVYVRCVLSMCAFNESLKEHEPTLRMNRESSQKAMRTLCYSNGDAGYGCELTRLADSLRRAWIGTEAFMGRIFTDRGKFLEGRIRDEESFLYDCFELAGVMQCCDHLGIDLYYIFSEDEIYDLWRYMNAYAYSLFGPAVRYGDCHLEDSKVLLKDFIDRADEVVSGKSHRAADLRFGHDANIIPLAALIGVRKAAARVEVENVTEYWNVSDVSPMAANLQMIFFRNRKGDVKVRVLYNEEDAHLPIAGEPFYDWPVLRDFLVSRSN